MSPVTICVRGFVHQPQGTGQINPVVGIWIGGLSVILTPAEAAALEASLGKARADALAGVASAQSNPALFGAAPAGSA